MPEKVLYNADGFSDPDSPSAKKHSFNAHRRNPIEEILLSRVQMHTIIAQG